MTDGASFAMVLIVAVLVVTIVSFLVRDEPCA